MKLINRLKKLLKKEEDNIALVIGLTVLFTGLCYTFILGLHSVDMMQNMIFMRDDLRIQLLSNGIEWTPNYIETKLSGDHISFEDGYLEGIHNLMEGIFLSISGAGITGYVIGRNYGKTKKSLS